ncbi:MAG: hypothetical protein VX768_02910 [Planctomycetota bacterium]|nr:hypothetical protein [Planctomycetota bacterium]
MSYPPRSFSLLFLFGMLAAASAVPLFAIQEELKQARDSSTVDSGFQRISIASLQYGDDKRFWPKSGLAPSPELVQLYSGVEQRGFCEEVFVAVLQGSKEGVVVLLFPPSPDVSRKKEGVQNNDPVSGIDIIDDKDATSANPHNSTRSNRGIRLDDQAEIVQCEGCGATCTEPCRCKPRGIELIWGQKGDLVRIFQKENQYHYVTFETDYGMRAVTLISMGEDQTLVIAKAWHACTGSPEEACPGIGGGDCNDGNREINPLAGVGVAHNRLLDYLTADLDLRLPALRHSNDKIVRKKPGRSAEGDLSGEGSDLFVRKRPGRKSFGDITLKKRSGTITEPSKAYLDACLFLSRVYDLPASGFLPAKQALVDMEVMTRDGYGYLQSLQKSVAGNAPCNRPCRTSSRPCCSVPTSSPLRRKLTGR